MMDWTIVAIGITIAVAFLIISVLTYPRLPR
jgi:hypothetical protein